MVKASINLDHSSNLKDSPLSRLLEMYRLRAGLTRKELAHLLELKSDRMVRIWENGSGLPTPDRLRQLLELYWVRNVFSSDTAKRLEEAARLWDTVKNKFEADRLKKEIYPAFDEDWFSRLKPAQPLPQSLENLSASTYSGSSEENLIHRHNFPTYLTNFVGREQELDQLSRLLQQQRLVTLTGPGGIGKTRLAVEAATAQISNFRGGVWLVELAALNGPDFLVATIARTLKLAETSGKDLLDELIRFLQPRHILLVLDNCEHLVDECARLVNYLLSFCADLKVLATSREALAINGEWIIKVPSLSLPDPQQSLDFTKLDEFEAIRLLVARGKASEPTFDLTPQNSKAIVEICARLDGIPLALEMVAAHLRGIGIIQLVTRLKSSLGGSLSSAGTVNRAVDPRHQTLRALTDWSYNLLEERAQVIFRRLAIFSGSWSLEAAEAVCAGEYQNSASGGSLKLAEILGLLAQLVNKSLLQVTQPEGRYSSLETIGHFARQKLDESGEVPVTAQRHFTYYLALAQQGIAYIGPKDQQAWSERLDKEQDNFRAALGWAISENRGEEAGLLALALWRFWQNRTYLREGQDWLEKIVALTSIPGNLLARLYNALGIFSQTLNQFDKATRYHEQALELWKAQGDKTGVAQALMDLGWHNFNQVELGRAGKYARECLEIAREVGEKKLIASALNLSAMAATEAGNLEGVKPLLEESLAIWRELGEMSSIASTMITLARLEQRLGNLQAAKKMLGEAIPLQLKYGNYLGLIAHLVMLLHLSLAAKKQPEGAKHVARVLGAMTSWNETIRADQSRWSAQNDEGHIKVAVDVLGREVFEQEFQVGRTMATEEILILAREIIQPAPEDLPTPVVPPNFTRPGGEEHSSPADELTGRELEVLALVVEGLSNLQIAQKLVVSSRTIEAHLRAIYAKLGVNSRSAATRVALEKSLV